jgi:hypothetical protein
VFVVGGTSITSVQPVGTVIVFAPEARPTCTDERPAVITQLRAMTREPSGCPVRVPVTEIVPATAMFLLGVEKEDPLRSA